MKKYDVVFNVAGIAQRKETMENAHLYYEVNEHLVMDLARKAKNDGVKQFIVLSSMSVYGKNEGFITKTTEPCPNTHYGISKLSADEEIKKLSDEHFKKAYLPILVTLFGILIFVSDEHFEKTYLPILVTLFGILINVTIMKKVFGNLTNEKVDCVNKFHFTESIKCSEGSDQ